MAYEVETFEINGVPIKVADVEARKKNDTLEVKVNKNTTDITEIKEELAGGVLHSSDIVDNLNNTDSNKVLSAKQGKVLKDGLDECFISVSNGKVLLADAITGKGVETSATDTFETMADNIEAIPSGSGDITVMEYTDTMYIYFDEIEVVE